MNEGKEPVGGLDSMIVSASCADVNDWIFGGDLMAQVDKVKADSNQAKMRIGFLPDAISFDTLI